MSIEIINQVKTFLIILGSMCVLAIVLGVSFAHLLKKNKYVIANGTLVDTSESNKRISYLAACEKFSEQLYSENIILQDFEPNLKRLEYIPSGKVSKMFINGRGSWRLTQGNILTMEYLKSAICHENKQKL